MAYFAILKKSKILVAVPSKTKHPNEAQVQANCPIRGNWLTNLALVLLYGLQSPGSDSSLVTPLLVIIP